MNYYPIATWTGDHILIRYSQFEENRLHLLSKYSLGDATVEVIGPVTC